MNIRPVYRFPLSMVIEAMRPPVFTTPFAAIEPLVAIDADLMLLDEILEHALGHVRLEDPHRPLRAIDRRRPLPLVAVLLPLLPLPRTWLVVVLPDAVVELAREAADDGLVAGVGEAEAAARQAAEVLVGTDDDDGLAQALRLDGGDHAGGSPAVDDEVELGSGRLRLRSGERQEQEEGEHSSVHDSAFGVRRLHLEQNLQGAPGFGERGLVIVEPRHARDEWLHLHGAGRQKIERGTKRPAARTDERDLVDDDGPGADRGFAVERRLHDHRAARLDDLEGAAQALGPSGYVDDDVEARRRRPAVVGTRGC